MHFKSFKIGKAKEKPERDTAPPAGDTRVAQIDNLEEQLNHRTRKLEATQQQLKDLSAAATGSGEDEDAAPRPHGPLGELEVVPGEEDDFGPEEASVGEVLAAAGEEVKVVAAPAATPPAAAEKKPAKESSSESLDSLFSQDEEEENPLANLISSLPDVTVQELLEDLGEIKSIIKER